MEHQFKIKPAKNIKDKYIIKSLPDELIAKLGKQVGKDYDLKYSKRDLYFENGSITYNPYRSNVCVTLTAEGDSND